MKKRERNNIFVNGKQNSKHTIETQKKIIQIEFTNKNHTAEKKHRFNSFNNHSSMQTELKNKASKNKVTI